MYATNLIPCFGSAAKIVKISENGVFSAGEKRRNGQGRKCAKENFNSICNCMKTRNLGLENFGRKYVKIFKKMFAIQLFLLPLQPAN